MELKRPPNPNVGAPTADGPAGGGGAAVPVARGVAGALPWVAAMAAVALIALSLAVARDHPLQNLDEGLYARIAQQMLERGDFVVPTLDGVPYLEKPPLVYWVTAAAIALLGPGEAAVRCAPLLGALLAVAVTAWFARRRLPEGTAAPAALLLATAPIVLVLGRMLLFDMLFTGLLWAALVTVHEALQPPHPRRAVRWSYGLLALAVLAKGFAALVLFAAIAAAAVATSPAPQRRRQGAVLADPVAIALLLAVALPWHLLAAQRQPGFAWFYFVNEHVLRFLGTRTPRDWHSGPWWYYLPRLAMQVFPWGLALLLPPRAASAPPAWRPVRRFLWIAALVPLAVFSASEAKGEYYTVVCVPALALLAADRLVQAREGARRAVLSAAAAAWIAAFALTAWIAPAHIAPYAAPDGGGWQLALGAAAAAAALLAAQVRQPGWAVLATAAACLPAVRYYGDFLAANEPLKSARSLAAALHTARAPVYLYQGFEEVSALPFYLREDVGVVDPRSEDLAYGRRLHPLPERFPDAATFGERARGERLWLVVPDRRAKAFAASELDETFVAVRSVGSATVYASPPLARLLRREPPLAHR